MKAKDEVGVQRDTQDFRGSVQRRYAEVRHKPSGQFVAESEAVDHLDEETVRDGVERLRDVHCYGYGSARGFVLVEARDHPSRDGEQGRVGGMPRLEAVLRGASAQGLHDGREDEKL